MIPDRLAELARALNLVSATDPVGVGVDRLNVELAARCRWLVVFDNAEEPRALAPFLPGGPGQVLITSRNPAWRGIATSVGVSEFDRGESVALLTRLAPVLSPEEADRVATAVGDLPLALEQAGAMLVDTGMPVDTYLQLLTERAEKLLDHDPGGIYPVSVAASWAVAFDRLATDDPTALDLLTLIAWCGPEPVTLTLLTDQPRALPRALQAVGTDALVLARCIAILHRRGMATVSPSSVKLHRVPAALLRSRTKPTHPLADSWAVRAVRVLHAILPADVEDEPATWPIWQALLPHVLVAVDPHRSLDTVAELVAWLLEHAADYHQARGQPRLALPLARRAHAITLDQHGADHLDTLVCAAKIAHVLSALGEKIESAAIGEDALARAQRVVGIDHPATLTIAGNVATYLLAHGDDQQARALAEDTLTRRRRTLGEDHPAALSSAQGLAAILRILGEHQQARELIDDTVIRARLVLGENHPRTLIATADLALDLHHLGEHQRAHDLDEDAFTRFRDTLGNDHPYTLTAASSLARDLRALGDHQQARTINEDTLARRRRTLGDRHPFTLATANNLADDLDALGEHDHAATWRAWALEP